MLTAAWKLKMHKDASKWQSWVKLLKDLAQLGTVQSIKSVYRLGGGGGGGWGGGILQSAALLLLNCHRWWVCLGRADSICAYFISKCCISDNFSEATLLPETVANEKFTGVIRLTETGRNFNSYCEDPFRWGNGRHPTFQDRRRRDDSDEGSSLRRTKANPS